jgi:hypothetical protein
MWRRTRNLIIIFIVLMPLTVLPHVKWGTGKPAPRSVFIQAYDSDTSKPIKTTVSFPIRATRDPSQPVVTAIGLGVQFNWLDRGIPLRFLIMSPGHEPVGASFTNPSSPNINIGLRPEKSAASAPSN